MFTWHAFIPQPLRPTSPRCPQAFKEKGDVPIAADGQGTRQSSPLITAFVLGLAATGGGLLLSTVEEAGLGAVSGTGCD